MGLIPSCGHWHTLVTEVCERCDSLIYRFNGNWFSCPNHMACCYRGQFPTGADLGVNHVPIEEESTPPTGRVPARRGTEGDQR
jgi:hypothetical protein